MPLPLPTAGLLQAMEQPQSSLPCLPPACKFQLRPADEHRSAGTAWHKFWIWFRSPVMLGQWILRWNPTTPLAVLTLCSEHFNLTSVILKSMMAAGKILYGSHYVKAVQVYFIFHCVVPQLWFPDKMLLVCAMFPDLPRLEKDVYSEAAAAAAKSLQSCPTLCDPIDGSPAGYSIPGILRARTLEWVAIAFSNACTHAQSLQSCPTVCDPMDSSPPGSSVHGIL